MDRRLRGDPGRLGLVEQITEDMVPIDSRSEGRAAAATRLGGRYPAVVPRPAFPWTWWVVGALLLAAAVCLVRFGL